MNTKLKLGLIALLSVGLVALLFMLFQSLGQNVPATSTPTRSSENTNAPISPSTEAVTSPAGVTPPSETTAANTPSSTLGGGTPVLTPTPTEGELAAAAAGTAKYSHYFPTVGECKRAVDNKKVANCVAPDSIKQVTRPEWRELFSHTDFYVIGFLGHDEVTTYDNSYRRDLVAWQDGQYYNAETYDRLLDTNGIVITDTNRELIIKAFVLMTLPDYLAQDITFSNWTQGDWPASFGRHFTYSITTWTKMQGLRTSWFFAFQGARLWLAERLNSEYHINDYVDIPFDVLPVLGPKQYYFRGQ